MSSERDSRRSERDVRLRPPNPRHRDNYPHVEKRRVVVCPECRLVRQAGRWYRGMPPLTEAGAELCPACRRTREHRPAGTLVLDARFLADRDEILGMLRNAEAAETAEHPLERIMELREDADGLVVTTTGVHLSRRIASKLERRFHRPARLRYSRPGGELRVDWSLDESA